MLRGQREARLLKSGLNQVGNNCIPPPPKLQSLQTV